MLNKTRKYLANLISPAKQAMNLGKDFLKYGSNRKMYGNWSIPVMKDEDFYTGYGYATVVRRANKTAKIAKENIRVESDIKDFEHPYSEIIDISRKFSDTEFWRVISTYLDIEGVFYLLAVRNFDDTRIGKIQSFELLNSFDVHRVIKFDKETGEELGGYIENKNGFQREIPIQQIIPIREFNPFKWSVPFSMADAAKENQFTIRESGDYTRKAIKGNLNSPGIITTDVILPEPEFKQFTDRVKGGGDGAPIFGNGPGAIKYESMTEQLSKADLKNINDINRDALLAVAGSSKTNMGIEESGTTRDTARLQRDLNTEDHIIPRIQLIIDALNLDYNNNYSEKGGRIKLIVDSPLEADHESDLKETEVKSDQFELYNQLVNKGYDRDIASQYVTGKITLEELGEPTNEPIMPPIPTEPDDEDDDEQENAIDREGGIVSSQQGALQNAVVNIDQQLVASALSKVEKNQFEDEEDIINKSDKSGAINELELILLSFFGLMFTFKGQETMRGRVSKFALPGQFKIDKKSRDYIKRISRKVSESHVDTVLDDILVTARESALEGKSILEIKKDITNKYTNVITETRAKAIARTETNRAFTRAQFDADRQFIEQNDLQGRAFKQWQTRSDNPCPFCLSLEAEGPKPFFTDFRPLGGSVKTKVKGKTKTLSVDFEALEAGNAHVNCACEYVLIIKSAENALKHLEKLYNKIDKRTKESKRLLTQMKIDRVRLAAYKSKEKEKIKKKNKKLDKNIAEVDKILDDHE